MTTGPEHYKLAEQLADKANHYTYGDGCDPVTGHAFAAEAQVHATLALAAAQALTAIGGANYERTAQEWLNVIIPPRNPAPKTGDDQ